MHVHVRISRWVRWWIYLGIACGAVAIANIIARDDLSRAQERIILLVGVCHWVFGGLICYALDGIRIESPKQTTERHSSPSPQYGEWHQASDFLLPGNRKRLLPPTH